MNDRHKSQWNATNNQLFISCHNYYVECKTVSIELIAVKQTKPINFLFCKLQKMHGQ